MLTFYYLSILARAGLKTYFNYKTIKRANEEGLELSKPKSIFKNISGAVKSYFFTFMPVVNTLSFLYSAFMGFENHYKNALREGIYGKKFMPKKCVETPVIDKKRVETSRKIDEKDVTKSNTNRVNMVNRPTVKNQQSTSNVSQKSRPVINVNLSQKNNVKPAQSSSINMDNQSTQRVKAYSQPNVKRFEDMSSAERLEFYKNERAKIENELAKRGVTRNKIL